MKRILQVLLIVTLFMGYMSESSAQNYMNVLNVRYYLQPGISLKDDSTAMLLSEYRIEAMMPLAELKNGTTLGIKPQFKSISLQNNDPASEDLSIFSVKLPVFAFIKWGESKWSSYVDISPKLNSDFENIGGRHFQLGGMVVNYYEKKKDFFWQFGLFYNQDTYGPFIMPLFGLDWKIDEKNYVAALLPAYLIYERKLGRKIYAGFELELSGESFRLGGSTYPNSFISQFGENKLTFMTEPRLFIDYYFAKHWVVYAKPGLRLFQKYEHYTRGDERITNSHYKEGILENNFYLELGIAMRFRYDAVSD